MKKNNIVWVKIDNKNYYSILTKLNDLNITIYDNQKNKDELLIKTTLDDYLKIKKYLISYKVTLYEVLGALKLSYIIKKYIVFILTTILSICLLFLVNNMIFKIDIKTPNKEIQELLREELKKYNLDILKLKKSHKKIEVIVEDILKNNKDTLEWLEIKFDGLVLTVNVTEKTKTNTEDEPPFCHVVAKMDAKIISLNMYRGTALKEINDYVLKDEVILSGEITFNDEVKKRVCAKGEIYGEVWYKVNVTVPFVEKSIEYTGKNRYNLGIRINDNNYRVFKSRIATKKDEIINLYKLNDFEINILKEKEYVEKYKNLTEEEAYNKGIKLALEKIQLQLDENEEILLKKVLKKEVNDSTIYFELFVATKENIGITKVADVVEEESPDDSELNKQSIQ